MDTIKESESYYLKNKLKIQTYSKDRYKRIKGDKYICEKCGKSAYLKTLLSINHFQSQKHSKGTGGYTGERTVTEEDQEDSIRGVLEGLVI